jgi:dCMP deaminase
MRPSWNEYYLDMCVQVSRRSSCVKRQNGCVIVLDNRIISTGYNGTPRGVVNCDAGGCNRCNDPAIPSGTRLDECLCSHSEENAIVQAAYHGVRVKGSTLYTQISPCLWCSKMIINAGIVKVTFRDMYTQNSLELLTAGQILLEQVMKV